MLSNFVMDCQDTLGKILQFSLASKMRPQLSHWLESHCIKKKKKKTQKNEILKSFFRNYFMYSDLHCIYIFLHRRQETQRPGGWLWVLEFEMSWANSELNGFCSFPRSASWVSEQKFSANLVLFPFLPFKYMTSRSDELLSVLDMPEIQDQFQSLNWLTYLKHKHIRVGKERS